MESVSFRVVVAASPAAKAVLIVRRGAADLRYHSESKTARVAVHCFSPKDYSLSKAVAQGNAGGPKSKTHLAFWTHDIARIREQPPWS